MAEITARTGLPRSTAHRVPTGLVELGWLTRTSGGFELGLALLSSVNGWGSNIDCARRHCSSCRTCTR
ncbi:helix-turn-helix domain-containing protein [Nocardia gipuzkoensis]